MRISDCSSDVCSSDLQDVWHHLGQCAKQEDGTCADYKAPALSASVDAVLALIERALGPEWIAEIQVRADGSCAQLHEFPFPCRKSPLRRGPSGRLGAVLALQTGRAACRERGCRYVEIPGVAGPIKN